jgi:catechol 2,3-dioxygenase-like lactoylglutathione lyase family enzyme
MSSGVLLRLPPMTEAQTTPTTVSNIGVAMFSVADQDQAIAFYTQKLGFELRSDESYGENGEMRWVEVAPPGSRARLALNPPMTGSPGGGSIGVETPDVLGEHARLSAIGGIDMDPEPLRMPDVPTMFGVRDPDGNSIWVVEADPSA